MDRQNPRVTPEVLEHAVLAASIQQERLHRNRREIRHDQAEFLREALGIYNVRQNETCHAGEQ
jgi:hypothetical protein